MVLKQILLWLPMIVIAFTNAMLRELIIKKYFNEFHAHQLSTITLIILCSIYIWFIYTLLGVHNLRQAFLIGGLWTLMTIGFEFILGRLTKKSWEDLFRNYNLLDGHLWVIFLFCLFLLPALAHLLRHK